MDEGSPIAFDVLKDGIPVYGSDGVQVGTVGNVIAALSEDIFHGIVISGAGRALHFVPAEQIGALHEFGVDLLIDSAAAAELPPPSTGAAVYDAEDPAQAKGWHHWVRMATLRGNWDRER